MMKRSILFSGVFISTSAIFYFFSPAQQNLQESIKRGKEVYTLNCQNCHMEDGKGQEGINPPLAKTTYLKDAKKNIGIVLNGQTGDVVVNGKKYNAIMNPMNYLDDQQIADVLNYVRNSWGNKYSYISPAQVKAERK